MEGLRYAADNTYPVPGASYVALMACGLGISTETSTSILSLARSSPPIAPGAIYRRRGRSSKTHGQSARATLTLCVLLRHVTFHSKISRHVSSSLVSLLLCRLQRFWQFESFIFSLPKLSRCRVSPRRKHGSDSRNREPEIRMKLERVEGGIVLV